jgi:CHAD domain-containing protein
MTNAVAPAISAYAAGEILDRIGKMTREIPGVIASEDRECLHRMRVATRRLRASLNLLGADAGLAGDRNFFKLVRSVTRSLGRARDLDVQIIWLENFERSCGKKELPGVGRLCLRLSQSREKLQPGIAEMLSGLSESRVMTDTARALHEARLEIEMKGGSADARGGDIERATKVMGLQIESLIQSSSALLSPDASEAQHRMRIETKRLRYAMEIYRGLYGQADAFDGFINTAKKLQDILGELHDADVWIERIPLLYEREKKFTARYYGSPRNFARLAPGYDAVVRDRKAARESLYGKAVEFWRATASQNAWGELRALLLSMYRSGERR